MYTTAESLEIIAKTESTHELIYVVKPMLFGSGSLIEHLSAQVKQASVEQKKEFGKKLTEAKVAIESAIAQKLALLEEEQIRQKLMVQKIDGSMPARSVAKGMLHPITTVAKEIVDIFKVYGFEIQSGPEIEDDWHNFTALNIPDHHPARQMHDTFYLRGGDRLLRTHTTAVDIKALIGKGAPIKAISFGRTFRCDSDRTHSPMFNQFEMLQVDKNVNMSDLKGYLMSFLRAFFGTNNIDIRMRPSFFPFTEPSAEVDIGYCVKNGRIVVGEEVEGFMEILGCGVLHPNVLKACNVDHLCYNGIAFGMGIERMAMLKYGINDLRKFFEPDLEWLEQNRWFASLF